MFHLSNTWVSAPQWVKVGTVRAVLDEVKSSFVTSSGEVVRAGATLSSRGLGPKVFVLQ